MGKGREIELTQDELQRMFYYDGYNLIWKVRLSNRTKVGNIAGYINTIGYNTIRINKRLYHAHRLIWVYHYGSIDKDLEIDHDNRIRSDNRLDNLKLGTHQQNQWNLSNTIGCCYDKKRKKWRSRIKVNSKTIYLGGYNTEEEGHQAYLDAKKVYHKIKV